MKKSFKGFIVYTNFGDCFGVMFTPGFSKPLFSNTNKQSCWDSVKGEYHSYFDSVEKCIEKGIRQVDK